MKHSILYLLLISLFSAGTAYSQAENPNGEIKSPDSDDIWAKTLEGSHYNEIWNYQFYLNEDITVHASFSVANFGSFKSAVSGVQLSIYNLEGELYQVSREYPIHYLVQDREQYMFQLRDERTIYFKGELPNEHHVKVRFSKDGRQHDVSLTLKNIQPGIVWEDGLYHIGDENVGMITHIPYAEAYGYVQVDDVRKDVYGTAYMDHTYQDLNPTDLVHSGYRFVHHRDKENWEIVNFMLPQNDREKRTVGHRISSVDGKIEIAGVESIEHMHESRVFGNQIARILDLEMTSSDQIRIIRTEDNQKFSVLGELGWLAKKAARSFLGGEVVNIRGQGVLMENGKRPVNGYYNFFKIE
jgi:hypothetical protein